MSKGKRKFNWAIFLEGMLYAFLAAVIFGGMGAYALLNIDKADVNGMFAIMSLTTGVLVVILITLASYTAAKD